MIKKERKDKLLRQAELLLFTKSGLDRQIEHLYIFWELCIIIGILIGGLFV